MLYQLKWMERPVSSRPGNALRFSQFSVLWKELCETGLYKDGEKYKVKIKNPLQGFTCTVCQTLIDRQRRASVMSEREELKYKLKQHLQQVTPRIVSCCSGFSHSTIHPHTIHTPFRHVKPGSRMQITSCGPNSTRWLHPSPLMPLTKRSTIARPARSHAGQPLKYQRLFNNS